MNQTTIISLATKRFEKGLIGEKDSALTKYYAQLNLVDLVNETQDLTRRILQNNINEELNKELVAIFKEIEIRLEKANDSFSKPLKTILIQLKENLYKLSRL